MEMDLGEVRMWGYMNAEMDLARRGKIQLAPNQLLLRAWDLSAPSPLGDEPKQRSRSRLFRIGAQAMAIASRRNDAPISQLSWRFMKKGHHGDEKKTPVVRALRPVILVS
jgi:hypothetical protein